MSTDTNSLSRIDLAYLCFGWIAVVPWIEPLVAVIPVGRAFQGFIVTLLSIPIVLGTLAAGLIGGAVTVVERRELSLVLMSLIVVGLLALFLAVEFLQVISRDVTYPAYLGSSVVLGLLCVRRLVVIRDRGDRVVR